MDDITVYTGKNKKKGELSGGGSQNNIVNNVNNKDNNKNCKKCKKYDVTFKRGLKVGNINVRGIVSSVNKRIELNNWIELNDLDVICIQEWYVPHNRQVSEIKDDESEDDNRYDNFEDERKNLSVALDMTAFQRYEKI